MNTEASDIEFEDDPLSEQRMQQEPETWLWCLHCRRFFQAKHLVIDFLGNRQQCPFEECGAAGLGVDIYRWDDWAERGWPATHQQLHFGMHSEGWR
jgi:hypothetical protein